MPPLLLPALARLASEAVREGIRAAGEATEVASRSWHLHLCSGAAAGEGEPVPRVVVRPSSVRLRSREVSARLPRFERASRRASTSSRLGLLTGRPAARREGSLAAGELATAVLSANRWARVGAFSTVVRLGRPAGRLDGSLAAGALACISSAEEGALVRLGRESDAVRTRPGDELKRPAAFLPPLVRALRRSRAASRLDVLAISARDKDVMGAERVFLSGRQSRPA